MLKYLGLYILIIPVLIFFFLELILISPSFVYAIALLTNAILVLLIFLFKKKYKNQFSIQFIIFPLLFLNSTLFYSLLITKIIFVTPIYFLCSYIIYKYFKNVYYCLSRNQAYKKADLENISSYGNLILVFFFFSGIFGLSSFLGISAWVLAIAIVPFISLIIYQVLWINGVGYKQSLLFMILGAFIILELAWAIFFLPYTNISLGLILTICYYVYIGLTRFYLKGNLENKIINRYLIVGVASIIIIILSSKV